MIINFVDYICLASILEEKTEKQIFTEKNDVFLRKPKKKRNYSSMF